MKALFCGDRNWDDRRIILAHMRVLKRDNPDLQVCEGGAKGADTIARWAAQKLDVPCTEYPADWHRYGRAAGPIRNCQMLKEFQPTHVFAFHDALTESKGTAHMVKIARAAGLSVVCWSHVTVGASRVATGKGE